MDTARLTNAEILGLEASMFAMSCSVDNCPVAAWRVLRMLRASVLLGSALRTWSTYLEACSKLRYCISNWAFSSSARGSLAKAGLRRSWSSSF